MRDTHGRPPLRNSCRLSVYWWGRGARILAQSLRSAMIVARTIFAESCTCSVNAYFLQSLDPIRDTATRNLTDAPPAIFRGTGCAARECNIHFHVSLD